MHGGVGRGGWGGADIGAETYAAFADAVHDCFVQAVKGSGADEENVVCLDVIDLAFLSAA